MSVIEFLTSHECRRPLVATLLSGALLVGIPGAGLSEGVEGPLRHAAAIATIVSVSWLVARELFLLEDGVLRRLRTDVRDNRRARRVRTQVAALRRITAVVVAVVGAAAVLMTFDTLRTYGASVLASAGVVGVIAGFAAQATLGNVIAGLQLVFTDALRFDDVVVVEGEWGRIEELTLTYVVVHLWDERRLVLPATYFTTTPFQNWTRSESRVLATVELHLDPTAPVAEIRERAHELIEANPLWDRREWMVQVTGMSELTIVLRVLASASDAASAWDLKCDLREDLIRWLQDEHPDAFLRWSSEHRTIGPERLTSATTSALHPGRGLK
ncbi:MAG TPA: mechanosensitive ion channel domain-containing protein [Nocardioidaceae bacterium]|nr:mechanosensitive ion channel domain-containing protein [Nocardioidaceae bacterium]